MNHRIIIRDVRNFYKDYSKYIKAGAVILTIAVAAFLFSLYGEDSKSVVIPYEKPESSNNLEVKPDDKSKKEQSKYIYVDISGQVKAPGVYKLKEGSRLFEAIDMAGGIVDGATLDNLNRAETLSDGQKVVVYTEEELESLNVEDSLDDYENNLDDEQDNSNKSDGKININKAGLIDLQKIVGVGPAMANKIISYREENGKFNDIEELKNIKGIGEKTYENLREQVYI